MKPAAKSILLGQLFFYTGLLICVLLKPAGLAANDGISYYGIYGETFPAYAAGLLGVAYFTTRALEQLPAKERVLKLVFKLYIPLIVLLTITPYAAAKWVDYLHTAAGSALFTLQLILSGYLAWRLHYVWWSIALAAIELCAGILSAIYLSPSYGFLFQTQTTFQIAFGTLLIWSLQRLEFV